MAGAALLSAGKHAEYKTAKVLDSAVTRETHSDGAITGSVFHDVTVQTDQLLLVADDYYYVVADTRERSQNLGRALATKLTERHHGCRFIVGETVKYAQDKGDLYVLDVDGKECKVAIVRQQKRTP